MISDEADDLNAEAEAETEGAEGTEGAASSQAKTVASSETTAADDKGAEAQAGKSTKTIAGGAEEGEAEPKGKAYWPTDWRQKMADYASAGDKKEAARLLKQLDRYVDPAAIFGKARELESKFSAGGLLKVPAKDAKAEEVEAFRKALGVPEKPEDYLNEVKLDNGATIGDADKPGLTTFAEAMHKVGAAPESVNAALNWYYQEQERIAADQEDRDEEFKSKSIETLKEELGPSFKREINLTASLFAEMPGGSNQKNENSFYAKLIGGRMADGTRIGDNPDFMRWLITLRRDVNPAASVVEDGRNTGQSLDDEIKKIEEIMRTDRPRYNKEYATRYGELLTAREKIQARQRA